MLFKKRSYPFNKNVPFHLAFKALTEGYLVKRPDYANSFLQLIYGKIYEINLSIESANGLVEDFTSEELLSEEWQIIAPNTIHKGKTKYE